METRVAQIEADLLDRINTTEQRVSEAVLDGYFGLKVDGLRKDSSITIHREQLHNAIFDVLGGYEADGLLARQPNNEELDEFIQTVVSGWAPEAFKPSANRQTADYGLISDSEMKDVLEGAKIVGIQMNIIGKAQLNPEDMEE